MLPLGIFYPTGIDALFISAAFGPDGKSYEYDSMFFDQWQARQWVYML